MKKSVEQQRGTSQHQGTAPPATTAAGEAEAPRFKFIDADPISSTLSGGRSI